MGIVALTRLGIVTPQQLSHNRRYAYLILAIVAMLLPGTDPVTMLIELAPLLALFEFSLILARLVGTPAERAASAPEPEPPGKPRQLGSDTCSSTSAASAGGSSRCPTRCWRRSSWSASSASGSASATRPAASSTRSG